MEPSPLKQQLKHAFDEATADADIDFLRDYQLDALAAAALSVLLPHLRRNRETLRQARSVIVEMNGAGFDSTRREIGSQAHKHLTDALHNLDKLIGDER